MISQNQKKLIRSLHKKKFREQHNLYIIEGIRSLQEALNTKSQLKLVVSTEEFSKNNPNLINQLDSIQNKTISKTELNYLSPSTSSSGILAIYKIPQFKNPNWEENIIFLDQVADPGNMGTILRSACWFGISQVALSDGCVDPFNPKVVRSAMGAHFRLSWIGTIELKDLKDLEIIGADLRGIGIDTLKKIPKNWVLAMGGEAHGLSNNVKAQLDQTITIPKIGMGESLNVGVATGILLYRLTQ